MTKTGVFGTGSTGQMAHRHFTNDSEFEIGTLCADADYIDDSQVLVVHLARLSIIRWGREESTASRTVL